MQFKVDVRKCSIDERRAIRDRVYEIAGLSSKGVNPGGNLAKTQWFFVDAFHALWDSINAARGYEWAVNPWVWVVEFKVV